MLGRRAPDVAPRLALDLAPLLESRAAAARARARAGPHRTTGRADAAQDPPRVLLDVFLRDAAARSGPCTSLMLTPISRARRRTAGDAGAAGRRVRRASGRRKPLRAGPWPPAESGPDRHRTTFLPGPALVLGRRLAARLGGWSACGRGGSRAAPAAAGRRRCLGRLRRPGHPTVSTTAPTLTLSPFLTLISLTTPATDEGTSIVALSVSSSSTG